MLGNKTNKRKTVATCEVCSKGGGKGRGERKDRKGKNKKCFIILVFSFPRLKTRFFFWFCFKREEKNLSFFKLLSLFFLRSLSWLKVVVVFLMVFWNLFSVFLEEDHAAISWMTHSYTIQYFFVVVLGREKRRKEELKTPSKSEGMFEYFFFIQSASKGLLFGKKKKKTFSLSSSFFPASFNFSINIYLCFTLNLCLVLSESSHVSS